MANFISVVSNSDKTPFLSQKAGTHTESFTSKHLRPEGGEPCSAEEEDVIKWCAGALYAGAGDTVCV